MRNRRMRIMDGVRLPTFDEVKASGAKPEPGVHL
jgi:hypothetical protein